MYDVRMHANRIGTAARVFSQQTYCLALNTWTGWIYWVPAFGMLLRTSGTSRRRKETDQVVTSSSMAITFIYTFVYRTSSHTTGKYIKTTM